jgi:hypothetical protein
MGMFDNVVFENSFILEGEQADAYKRRKYYEKKEKERREKSYKRSRRGTLDFDNSQRQNPNASYDEKRADSRDGIKRFQKANHAVHNTVSQQIHKGKNPNYSDITPAIDATLRHYRKQERKAKHEAAMMLIRGYNCDYAY